NVRERIFNSDSAKQSLTLHGEYLIYGITDIVETSPHFRLQVVQNNIATGEVETILEKQSVQPYLQAVSADGRYIYYGYNPFYILDRVSGSTKELDLEGPITSFKPSADGRYAAVHVGDLIFLNLETGER